MSTVTASDGARVRRTRLTLQAIVMVALWGLITHGTFAGSGDEPHYLAIAHSAAFDFDLDLSNNYGANEPLIGGGTLQFETHVRPGAGGVPRPVHDVGMPLAFAPYVRVAVPITRALTRLIPPRTMERARLTPAVLYRHLLSLAMIGLTAILAGLMFDVFVWLGGSGRAAFWTTLLLILSPPILILSVLFFTELLSALLCFIVFRGIFVQDIRTTAGWRAMGAAAGFLFLVHARNIGLVVPLAALAFYTLRAPTRRRDAAAFAIGLIFMIAIRTAINYYFWGSFVGGPHAKLGDWPGLGALLVEMSKRTAGLLVDQEAGLLPYAPIYILAAAGLSPLLRQQPRIAWSILLVIGTYIALVIFPLTNIHGFAGGWSPPARMLTPILPLVGIFVLVGLRAAPRALTVALVAIQIAINAYSWQHPKILWNDMDGRAAFCEQLDVCRYLPSLAVR